MEYSTLPLVVVPEPELKTVHGPPLAALIHDAYTTDIVIIRELVSDHGKNTVQVVDVQLLGFHRHARSKITAVFIRGVYEGEGELSLSGGCFCFSLPDG